MKTAACADDADNLGILRIKSTAVATFGNLAGFDGDSPPNHSLPLHSNHSFNTTEFDLAEPFDCHCGSPGCFGTIRGFKYLTADERERLQPMLAPYLSRLFSPCAEFASR